MSNTISNLALIFRSMVSLVLLGLLGSGGWLAYQAYDSQARLERELQEKTAEVARLTKENERLELALRLLKVDHRVAEIEVLDQQHDGERSRTRLQFVEMTEDGTPIGKKKTFDLEGDTVYIDAWVIKYDDKLVEGADPLLDLGLPVPPVVRRIPAARPGFRARRNRLAAGGVQPRR